MRNITERGINMNENLKKILKNTGLILVIILISALLVRHFSGSETLSEYTNKNPSAQNTGDTTAKEDTADATENIPSSDIIDKAEEELPEIIPENRITYKEGFYYEPLSLEIIDRITGCSYPILEEGETIEISYEDLSYLVVQYVGFDYETHRGEIICNNAIAKDLAEIFYELYRNEYQIESIALIEEYNGDDLALVRPTTLPALITERLSEAIPFPNTHWVLRLTLTHFTILISPTMRTVVKMYTRKRPLTTPTEVKTFHTKLMKMICAISYLKSTASPGADTGTA